MFLCIHPRVAYVDVAEESPPRLNRTNRHDLFLKVANRHGPFLSATNDTCSYIGDTRQMTLLTGDMRPGRKFGLGQNDKCHFLKVTKDMSPTWGGGDSESLILEAEAKSTCIVLLDAHAGRSTYLCVLIGI